MRQTHTTLESAFGAKAVSGIMGLGSGSSATTSGLLTSGNTVSATSGNGNASAAASATPLTLVNVGTSVGLGSSLGGGQAQASRSLFDEPNPGED
jgi:hypothetical protein